MSAPNVKRSESLSWYVIGELAWHSRNATVEVSVHEPPKLCRLLPSIGEQSKEGQLQLRKHEKYRLRHVTYVRYQPFEMLKPIWCERSNQIKSNQIKSLQSRTTNHSSLFTHLGSYHYHCHFHFVIIITFSALRGAQTRLVRAMKSSHVKSNPNQMSNETKSLYSWLQTVYLHLSV
jgi:hypothetical protein